MVSTRGVKLKFLEGERVLCYEPDPTKAKVLYDSKVLDVFVKKDSRGKKYVEYMIHFQGWNSSWDRSVSEEFVLKDTPENRQLQRDLAEKSQLQIGAYLYRKERKKHTRNKTNDRLSQCSEDGSIESTSLMGDVENQRASSTSEDEESSGEEVIPIDLTPFLRECLEKDKYLIKEMNKFHKLPCEVNVVKILELYWKHYALLQLSRLNKRQSSKYKQYYNNSRNSKPENVQKNLVLCREVLDGIRIYFDFTLKDHLLYNSEKDQVLTGITRAAPLPTIKDVNSGKLDPEEREYAHLPVVDDDDSFNSENDTNVESNNIRRNLRSNKSYEYYSNGVSHKEKGHNEVNTSVETNGLSTQVPEWKAVPDCVYKQQPLPPCLIYGAVHLTRLFVKLPELLSSVNMDGDKLKILLEHFRLFVQYLSDHKEWFNEEHIYSDA